MRTNIARGVIVVFASVVLSGCYSNGGWHMPGQSSPFQSSQTATPGSVGAPTKPAGIAATGGPTQGYSTAGNPMAPMVSQGAPANYGPTGNGYQTPQYSYPPSNTNGVGQTTTPSGYGATPYTATTAGVPGARAYGSTPDAAAANGYGQNSQGGTGTASPYGSANQYANPTAVPPYNANQPASNYNPTPSYNSPSGAAGGYGAANSTSGGYVNPVRSAQGNPYPSTSYPSTTDTNGYGGSGAPYGNSAGSSGTSYGAGSGSRYGNPTSNAYGPSGTTAPSGSNYSTPSSTGGYAQPATGGYAQPATGGYAQPATGGYGPSGTTAPSGSSYATPAAGGATQPASNYSPAGSGYTPPASDGGDSTQYRPGSTSSYAPRSSGAVSTGVVSTPAANSGVTPAGYNSPAGSQ